jgi:Ubiquitin-conjugating enzyme
LDFPYDHRRVAKIKSKDEKLFKEIVKHLNGFSNVQLAGDGLLVPPHADADNASSRSGSTMSINSQRKAVEPGYRRLASLLHLKVFYGYVHNEILNQKVKWEILDEEFEDNESSASAQQRKDLFRGGTYYFCYPGHESTVVVLSVPSKTADDQAAWTIRSPNAKYHPGEHHGHLNIPLDYPSKGPRVEWESPILSAFVNTFGKLCLDEWTWNPSGASFFSILRDLASIVIFGPELHITDDPTAPTPRPDTVGRMAFLTRQNINDANEDWIMRVTHLFSRAYNRTDDDGELDLYDGGTENAQLSILISQADRETSILAIEDVQRHLAPILVSDEDYQRSLRDSGLTDVRQAFKGITTLRNLLKTERVWVDGINVALGKIVPGT